MENTDPRHLLVKISKLLKRLKIPYLVTGGIAVLVWGRPRFTADIDIVIELKEEDIDKLTKSLLKIGKASYVDVNAIREALKKENEFNFIEGDSGIKIDFWLIKRDDAFDVSRFRRRVVKNILGEKIYFTTAEDLILIKALWYKISPMSRQLEDIESIIKISGRKLDIRYLRNWAKKLNVSEILPGLI